MSDDQPHTPLMDELRAELQRGADAEAKLASLKCELRNLRLQMERGPSTDSVRLGRLQYAVRAFLDGHADRAFLAESLAGTEEDRR